MHLRQVFPPQTLINVNASPPVKEQHVSSIAAAGKRPRRVDAESVAAAVVVATLVDILARRTTVCLLVAEVTDALVSAHHVFTHAVRTDSAGHPAFVDIFTTSSVLCEFVAYRTLTEERARCVYTLASSAKTSVLLTFVDVHAHLHHRRHLKAFMATAGEASFGIDTGSVATHSVQNAALVNIHALEALLVQGKSLVAPATE